MNRNSITSSLRALVGGAMMLGLFTASPARADYQSGVLGQNPLGYWRLDETSQPPANNAAANSGSLGATANGAYMNSPTRALAGPFAGSTAVGFDGVSQYVSTPYNAAINNSTFTLELWVNPKIVPNGPLYIANSSYLSSPRKGWYLAQDAGGTFGFGSAYVFRTFINSSTTPGVTVAAPVNPAGTWCHLVVTYDSASQTATMYTNGVVAMSATGVCVPNASEPFNVGCRNAIFFWPGQAAEVAVYSSALSGTSVANHYNTAMTTPANYAAAVLANSPVAYYRYTENNEPTAPNISTAGSALNGLYQAGTTPGINGPRQPDYPGLEANNYAVSVPGTGPSVRVPAFNINTNTFTISGWVKASVAQNAGAGIFMCDGGTTYAGLNMDVYGGYGLSYTWNNDPNSYNWVPTVDNGLPPLPDNEWAYVALVVKPDQAWIYTCASNQPLNFAGATNFLAHVNQKFDTATLFGTDGGYAAYSFNGGIDEVAVWNRALGVGELYSQMAAAVGGLGPKIFSEPQNSVSYSGDPFTVAVDVGGTPSLTYQWSKLSSGPIAGATNSSYTVDNAQTTDSDTYSCYVVNAYGSVTTVGAVVTVNQSLVPAIVTPPVGHTLYPGGTLNLSVTASGGGLRYQWKKNGTNLVGATTSAYVIPSVATNNSGSYSVVCTNSQGQAPAGPVTVTVRAPANNYETVIVADKPEAWFRLDEASGTNMWDSMGRHDGNYTNVSGAPVTFGAPGAVVGSSDTAVTFDGTSQSYGIAPYSDKLNSAQFTIECWAKTTNLIDPLCPVSSRSGVPQGYWLFTVPSGAWSGGVSQSGNNYYVPSDTASDAIVAGEWKHIVMAYGTSLRVYINGQWDGYGYVDFEHNLSAPFIVGARGGTALSYLFNGQVDEVLVYTNALTQAQAASHYSAAVFPNPTPPFFLSLPASQEVVSNANSAVTLSGVANGSMPITYQWYKNGSALAGATNSALAITAVYTNAASYRLQASNQYGSTNAIADFSVLPPTPAYVNVTNGLVLHLTFDGNYADSSGRANNGSATGVGGGTPSISAGRIGSGAVHYETHTTTGIPYNLNTNAVVTDSGYVTLGNPADLQFGSSVNFSVAYWVKLPVGYVNGDLPFLCSAKQSYGNPGFTFAPGYTNGGWSYSYNGSVEYNDTPDSINDGNWHHLVQTVDRTGNAVSYVDGVQADSRLATGIGNINTAGPINIGQDPTGLYPEVGSADVDDLAIWRRALTAYEAYSIYYAATNSNSSFNVPGTVTLNIQNVGTNVVLTWNPGSTLGTLLEADSVNGPWTKAAAYTPVFTVTPGAAKKFYRLSLSE